MVCVCVVWDSFFSQGCGFGPSLKMAKRKAEGVSLRVWAELGFGSAQK